MCHFVQIAQSDSFYLLMDSSATLRVPQIVLILVPVPIARIVTLVSTSINS